jgi:YbbR domain-containing protein
VDVRLDALDNNDNIYNKVTLEPAGATVTVNVADRIITKTVPVKAAFTGTPPGVNLLRQILIDPQAVQLTGPFAQLAPLEEVFTENVILDKLPAGPLLIGIKLPPGVTADTDRVTVVFGSGSGRGM